MNWDWINDLRVISFHEATSGDSTPEFFLREVFRWYGSTYAMSPHLVEELPLYDVLRHYFEVQAKNALDNDDAAYQRLLSSIVYGEEVQKDEVIAEIEDDEFMQKVKEGAYTGQTPKPRAMAPKMAPGIRLPAAVEPELPEFETVDFSELAAQDMSDGFSPAPAGLNPPSSLSRLERARRQR